MLQDVTRLMRFDELKNDLVATVAHEFRTPLTSLRMAIHLCAEQAVGPLTEKQADLLYAARQDCERLQQIVDDLLDLSRIQSGRIELHQRPVDAASLARDAAQAFRAPAEAKGDRAAPRGAAQPGHGRRRSRAHRARVREPARQRDALHAGRRPRSRSRRSGATECVRFEVTDKGPGVPPELRQAIFEKFFRVPGRDRAAARGWGCSSRARSSRRTAARSASRASRAAEARFWFTLPAGGANAG